MSDKELTFLDRCLRGEVSPDDIDDAVEEWHMGPAQSSLAEFLGFSDEEYSAWILNPSALNAILQSRRSHLPLSKVLKSS